MAFNFTQTATGGFSFGAPATAQPAAAAAATTGFSLQTSAPAGGGFSFGTSQPQTQGFGNQPPQIAQPMQNNGSAQGGFSFGAQTQSSTPSGGFSFGAPRLGTPATSLTANTGATLGASTPGTTCFALGGLNTQMTTHMTQPTTAGFSTPMTQPPTAGFSSQMTQPPTAGFSSQMTQPPTAGFSSQMTQPPTAGFSTPMTQPPTAGFSTQMTQPATAGFSTQMTQPATAGFSFGTPKIQATSAAPAQPTLALSLGGQSTGFSLGAPASMASAPALNFGTLKTSATPAPVNTVPASLSSSAPVSSLFAASITSTPPTGFTLGSSMASVASAVTSASSAPTMLTLKPLGTAPAITTAAASTGAPSGFSLGLKPAVSTAPATTIAVTSTASITTSTAPVMSYAQLEALINKWSSELEDQERHFLQQATQVNAWDRMLVENGEKITALHKDMEKVKLDQRRLDQELDFILSQQKELEDLLAPLEESVKEQSGTIYMQNADEERERTYKLAENVDAQLKRMSQDLKEIIEHLNTSSGPADTTDPLQQICKILNAHMDSLQWVEQNSVLLQRRLEEVSKLCDNRSKEQEKSFRLNFQ
ncbi:Nuclear pore glycoprotein p62 62 kDa nucleoporin [Triplophysa tibetana]|uniref:Nuclear pore glycoprotein p62 n=1 Tax=Triplophysa tibetana TaxID=1572043 RepID=A0A5A9NLK0_9TELE|nr:Nuclear pore glycoprotein p62 62 kDa nucleoporin [Triplophysa tibetana]